MSKNQQVISELISSISGQANILTIPKVYIDLLDGDINSALLLSQCVYWSDRTTSKDGWFYKSYREWGEEIRLSQYAVNRSASKLKKLGFIETKLKKANGAPTVHYRVKINSLTNSIMKKLDNGLSRNSIIDYEETQQSLTVNRVNNVNKNVNKEVNLTTLSSKTDDKTNKEKEQKPKTLTEQQMMVGVLSRVTGLDVKIVANRGRLGKDAKELVSANYSAENVEKLYTKGGWWYLNDWRGKKGQAPKLQDIKETIGIASKSVTTSREKDEQLSARREWEIIEQRLWNDDIDVQGIQADGTLVSATFDQKGQKIFIRERRIIANT